MATEKLVAQEFN